MSGDWSTVLWGLAWVVATGAFFALPLWPAWREWRSASDASPLEIDDLDDGQTSYRARSVARQLPWLTAVPPDERWHHRSARAVRARDPITLRAGERAELLVSSAEIVMQPGSKITRAVHGSELRSQGIQLPVRASADETLVLEPGTQFFRMSARLILTTPLAAVSPTDMAELPPLPPGSPRPANRHFHRGTLVLGAGKSLRTDLVILGDLHMGEAALIEGNVKVHGNVRLEAGAQIEGALFANGRIECDSDNRISGPVCAAQDITLGARFQGGRPRHACSVSGWHVVLGPGVRVFGSITGVTGGEVTA